MTDPKDDAAARAAAELRRAEAEATKAEAEAQAAVADAQQRAVAAYVPDLSRVSRGSLELKGDAPLFMNGVTQRALDVAATRLVEQLGTDGIAGTARLLITSDAELAASDAAYADVVTGMDELVAAADALLAAPDEAPADVRASAAMLVPALGAVGQVAAAALPGVLSLLSAHRTVTTASARTSDLAAAASVAGELRRRHSEMTVVHDDIRLVPRGDVYQRLRDVGDRRRRLVARRVNLTATGPAADDKYLQALLAAADALVEAIDRFTSAARTIPQGATRAPLTLAALHEQLHGDPANATTFTHVLFVQGTDGSVQQVTDDRPLWFKDRFEVVGSAGITYLLIDVPTSHVLSAGTAAGTATIHGRIGDSLTFEVVRPG